MNDPNLPGSENKKKKKQKNFLVTYGFSLLAIAFVLVLLSFLGQIRASEQTIADLIAERETMSISAMDSIQDLEDENKELKAALDQLQGRADAQAAYVDQLELRYKALDHEKIELLAQVSKEQALRKKQLVALETALDVNKLYAQRNYNFASYKIVEMEDGQTDYMDTLFEIEEDSSIGNTLSRYAAVRTWLEDRGYLNPDRVAKWAEKNPELTGSN